MSFEFFGDMVEKVALPLGPLALTAPLLLSAESIINNINKNADLICQE